MRVIVLLLLLLQVYSPAQSQQKGIIYFVFGSDSSTPGIGIVKKSVLYNSSGFDLFTSPNRYTAKIVTAEFRNRYKDSEGNPFRFTW